MIKNILRLLLLGIATIFLAGCLTARSSSTLPTSAYNPPAPSKNPEHLAVLLPLTGPFSNQGKAVQEGLLNAYNANQIKYQKNQTITFYDTNLDKNIATLYQKAINEGADFVIGPLTKEDAQVLANQDNFSVPTLELNYTETAGKSLPHNLYQFGLSPTDEAKQLAEKAKAAGYAHAIIITTDNDWGHRIAQSLTARWQENGGSIQEVLYVSTNKNLAPAIANLLQVPITSTTTDKERNKILAEKQHRHDIDVLFLLTPPQTARMIVPLIKFYYVNRLPIYATSIVYAGTPSLLDHDLEGVTFCDSPAILSGKNTNRLYAVGFDAYTLSNQLANLPIDGITGTLSLNSEHQINRYLPWTTMHDGHP